MVRVAVLYPNEPGEKFGAPGSAAPCVAIGHVYTDALDGFPKGLGQHGKEIMADIAKYTDIQPQMQISEVVG